MNKAAIEFGVAECFGRTVGVVFGDNVLRHRGADLDQAIEEDNIVFTLLDMAEISKVSVASLFQSL